MSLFQAQRPLELLAGSFNDMILATLVQWSSRGTWVLTSLTTPPEHTGDKGLPSLFLNRASLLLPMILVVLLFVFQLLRNNNMQDH
jgi:hypothetical protein